MPSNTITNVSSLYYGIRTVTVYGEGFVPGNEFKMFCALINEDVLNSVAVFPSAMGNGDGVAHG